MDDGTYGNRLLNSLPADVTRRLLRGAELVPLPLKTILFEPSQEIMSVHFPTGGVISLVTPHSDGSIVEVATIGNEGIVGVPLVLGDGFAAVRAISQVAGEAIRVDATAFVNEVTRGGEMATLVQRYMSALFSQISVAAGCNRLHPNEERLSRWLLMSSDRVGSDDFPITQEFLGQMLGSRRATVTMSAGVLQKAGLISYRNGKLRILDRAGLEAASCECYAVIKHELDRVVTRTAD